jgi:hypothetical protein
LSIAGHQSWASPLLAGPLHWQQSCTYNAPCCLLFTKKAFTKQGNYSKVHSNVSTYTTCKSFTSLTGNNTLSRLPTISNDTPMQCSDAQSCSRCSTLFNRLYTGVEVHWLGGPGRPPACCGCPTTRRGARIEFWGGSYDGWQREAING